MKGTDTTTKYFLDIQCLPFELLNRKSGIKAEKFEELRVEPLRRD